MQWKEGREGRKEPLDLDCCVLTSKRLETSHQPTWRMIKQKCIYLDRYSYCCFCLLLVVVAVVVVAATVMLHGCG